MGKRNGAGGNSTKCSEQSILQTLIPRGALPTSNPISVWNELESAAELQSALAFLWQQTRGDHQPFSPHCMFPIPSASTTNSGSKWEIIYWKKTTSFCGVNCQRGSWKIGFLHCFLVWWSKLGCWSSAVSVCLQQYSASTAGGLGWALWQDLAKKGKNFTTE